jgi:DNA mismatch repair protein MSH3
MSKTMLSRGSALQARVDAIEEIMNNKSYHLEKMRSLLVNMPDLVRGLTRIQYGKVRTTLCTYISRDELKRPRPRLRR